MALIADLAARLKETTDELEAELQSRYCTACPLSGYPLENRRFYRDMASVRAARALLADYEASKTSPQFDALLCELGAIGVRLDVLAGK